MSILLSEDLAAGFARIALGHVEREYPNKLDHVLNDAADLKSPRALHPIFFGSFDWHSCVHVYWLLATVARRFPNADVSPVSRALFNRQFTAENVAGECAYLGQPMRGGFERPYGWAWLLMLHAELLRASEPAWSTALQPLTSLFVDRFRAFLPKATYPVRVGTHFNTAFALALALEYADAVNDHELANLFRAKAVAWYGTDADCQAWEPGGDDFLSSALIEAHCMRQSLKESDFGVWLARFLPRLARREPASLFEPATVSDRTDGKIAHLDGVNLSRAWCWRSLAEAMQADDPRRALAVETARSHLHASLPHVSGDYMGEHWLATFALLALR